MDARAFINIPAYNLKPRLKRLQRSLERGQRFVATEYGCIRFFIVAPDVAIDLRLTETDEIPVSKAYQKNDVQIGDLDCLFLTYHGRRRVALIHPRHQSLLINTA